MSHCFSQNHKSVGMNDVSVLIFKQKIILFKKRFEI